MRYSLALLAAVGLAFGLSTEATAQTAQQNVTVVVQEINAMSVSSGAVSLTINAASTPGENPDAVSNSSTTYSITTNGSNKKITGHLDSNFATGISLSANLAAPSGSGSSAGAQTLSTAAQDLISGLTRVAASGLTITYSASATVEAEPNSGDGETQAVIFTITDA